MPAFALEATSVSCLPNTMNQRAVIGAVCAVFHLGIACAFLPAGTLSSSAWRPTHRHVGSSSHRAADCSVLRGGGDAPEGRVAGMVMSAAEGVAEDDLYIVGAGYLGKQIAQQWHEKFPSAKIYAETRTSLRHEGLMPEGVTFVLRKNRPGTKFHNVVFCAAPKGNPDYESEVFLAAARVWDGQGMFVFTSSGGIFKEKDGGVVTETSPIDASSIRTNLLGSAEAMAIGSGGCALRLAGLYSVERGPHGVWLTMDKVDKHPEGLINLLAYEDAAGAVVAALIKGRDNPSPLEDSETPLQVKGRALLAADDEPTSRRKICELALQHPEHGWKKMPQFMATGLERWSDGATKVYDCSETRKVLEWEPRYKSITEYFEHHAKEVKEVQAAEAPASK